MRKILTLVVTLAIIMCSLPVIIISATTVEFAGGSGTKTNPYLIETKAHLNNIRNDLDAHYKMVEDIVFTAEDFSETGMFYNDGNGFMPIGTYDSPFSGSFDGNNHYVKGIYINIETSNQKIAVGLFGYSTGAISNLGVADGLIRVKALEPKSYVATGGVVGESGNSIDRCYNSCSIASTATGAWSCTSVGGVVGASSGTVTNCYNTGNIYSESDEAYAGGIVAKISGYVSETVIQSCVNLGNIACEGKTTYYGAIAGYSYQGNAMWCYYKLYSVAPFGNSNAQKTYIYGLTESGMATERSFDGLTDGWTLNSTFGHPVLSGIENIKTWNYSEFAGGIGTSDEPYLIENHIHLDNVRYNLDSHFLMIADIFFDDSDYQEGGLFYNNGSGWEPIGGNGISFGGTFDGNNHTIHNLRMNWTSNEDLYVGLFGSIYNGTVCDLNIQDADIVASAGVYGYIGTVAGHAYKATISNCIVSCKIQATRNDPSSSSYVGGILGEGWDVFTENLHSTVNIVSEGNASVGGVVAYQSGRLANATCYGTILSEYSAGGIADSVSGCVVSFCENNATVSNTPHDENNDCYASCSGIVGGSYESIVEYCVNNGNVTVECDREYCGVAAGIVGGCDNDSVIRQCYNTADITTLGAVGNDAGGIAGRLYFSEISNCYNTGKITSSDKVGGILSFSQGNTISTCYNVGDLAGKTIGGIIGEEATINASQISACFFLDSTLQGIGNPYDGDATSCYTSSQLKTKSDMESFDFSVVWTMAGDPEYPYPELQVFCKSVDGDVNGDDVLDTTDARLALKNIVGLVEFTAEQAQIADMNKDGKLNSADVRRMLLTITANA